MGRQGDPEDDIGPVARFLCSDACRYLTGQTLMVDGGAFLLRSRRPGSSPRQRGVERATPARERPAVRW